MNNPIFISLVVNYFVAVIYVAVLSIIVVATRIISIVTAVMTIKDVTAVRKRGFIIPDAFGRVKQYGMGDNSTMPDRSVDDVSKLMGLLTLFYPHSLQL